MALPATANACADAVIAAKKAVLDGYRNLNRELTADEIAQMKLEVERAQWATVFAHIVANTSVNVTVASVTAVTTGAGVSGPGVGTGTLV